MFVYATVSREKSHVIVKKSVLLRDLFLTTDLKIESNWMSIDFSSIGDTNPY